MRLSRNNFLGRKRWFWFLCLTAIALALHRQAGSRRAPIPESAAGNRNQEDRPKYNFHSTRKYGEVRIPFTIKDGQICVKAKLAGRLLKCCVDTGCDRIIWNRRWNLRGKYTNVSTNFSDDGGNHLVSRSVILPSLQLGGYEVSNIATRALGSENAGNASYQSAWSDVAVLGNAAFAQAVLTIDYQQNKLILRDSSYDITKHALRPGDCLLDFIPIPSDSDYRWAYYIDIPGKLAGYPVRFLFDTGALSAVSMTRKFAERANIPPGQRAKALVMLGMTDTEITTPIPFSFANVHGSLPAVVIPIAPTEAGLGYQLLRYFRVTIDYPRKKLLLEPYALQGKPQDSLPTCSCGNESRPLR